MLSIMNYTRTETIEPGTVKGYYPANRQDPDRGQSVLIADPISPDSADCDGWLVVVTPSGARTVPSVDVGVWIEEIS